MRDDSVRKYLSDVKKGTVFCISDIPTEGSSYDSVKVQLARACSSGEIERICRGVYYKPKFSEFLKVFIPFRIQDLVDTLARMNGWRIIPSGNACLNMLGLSTQVPVRHVYYSDGPSHEYDIKGVTIVFKHRSPRNFPASDHSAYVVQAVKAQGKNHCDGKFVTALSEYLKEFGKGNLLEETCNAPLWVRKVITEACRQ